MEKELADLRTASAVVQLPRGQEENNEVKAHRVDEHRRQDDRVSGDDHTAAARYPLSFDDNT